ncbi:MAG TPA: geranylgeranylglycerol-phosphate geranylgeranyltransferase, partial [Chitinophagaceae bacterium]|nr:geranylgeranylglycerol-phosphate geranylgeranyltransferase [Chitinophagaceae bacterium]
MKLVLAFLKLIRVPNLFFIGLTQVLFHFCIILPIFKKGAAEPVFNNFYLLLLILSSILIAAAGYIINDYFDINIDQVNKPQKNVVDKIISRRWAMLWHSLFSFFAVATGFYIGWKLNVFWLGLLFFFCSVLLFFYSTTFKKKLLSGNLIISILTAWSVSVLGLATFYIVLKNPDAYTTMENSKILRFTILYGAFAFIISLILEAIKDMEDLPGDAKYGCRTMPIVWGINATKIYTAVWLCVLICALLIIQVYLLQYKWWWPVLYSIVFITSICLLILRNLFKA